MESLRVYDSHRGPVSPAPGIAAYPDSDPGDEPWNRNGWFNCLHMSKYGITLELTEEKGRRVFEELVSISDVVVENFRQGSLSPVGVRLRDPAAHPPRPHLCFHAGIRQQRPLAELRCLRHRTGTALGHGPHDRLPERRPP